MEQVGSAEEAATSGVCVVRVDGCGSEHVVVTVRGNLDVRDERGEWVVHTADVDHAKGLVMRFFRDCLNRG